MEILEKVEQEQGVAALDGETGNPGCPLSSHAEGNRTELNKNGHI
jgi:hypothetical protein